MRRYLILLVALAGCAVTPAARVTPPLPAGSDRASAAGAAPGRARHGDAFLTDDERYVGAGTRVVVLGDSLTNRAHDRLHEAFDRRGHRSLIVSANGEGFSGGPWTESFGLAEPWIVQQAEETAALDPDVAVVALGTNDAWLRARPLDESLTGLEEVFDAYGGACTVAVLVAETPTATGYDAAAAVAINDALEARADAVVDWRLGADPAVDVEPDGIHLTDPAALVDPIVEAAERCGPARTPTR